MNTAHYDERTQEVRSTPSLPHDRRFAAWRKAVVDVQGFPASMRTSMHGCAQIAHEDGTYLTIVMVAEGSETLRFGSDGEVLLAEGMFMLWNSTRPMALATGARLRQMSLPIPEAELLRRMPRLRDLVGRPMGGRHGAGGLFVDHCRSLMQRFDELPAASREPVLNTTLDLLSVCLREQPELPSPRLRQLTLQQVQSHIRKHLADPELSVASLARSFRMSERNIHKLFAGTGTTTAAYIRDQRLAMCRRDLISRSLMARQVSEIARHWGFADPGHFSKVFRAAYGVSPSEWRAQTQAGAEPKEPPQTT